MKKLFAHTFGCMDNITKRKVIVFIQTFLIIFFLRNVVNVEINHSDWSRSINSELAIADYHLFMFYSFIFLCTSFVLIRTVSVLIYEEVRTLKYSIVYRTCVIAFLGLFLMAFSLTIVFVALQGKIPYGIYYPSFIKFLFLGFHFVIYYMINYYISFSILKLPDEANSNEYSEIKEIIKSKLRILLRKPTFYISLVPVLLVFCILAFSFTVKFYASAAEMKNKPAEYFDTAFKRQMWWYSLDTEWKEVFKTFHFESYLYTDSWPLSELKYIIGMPYFPDDEYISYFFKTKTLNCDRYYSYGGYTPPRQMSKYLTNLSGMSSLTNITSLYLGNSRIVNFKNLEKLKKLKTLWIENTNLKNLEIIELVNKNLTDLRLDYNFLTSLKGINKLKNLKILNCRNNKIESLEEISELSKLEFLDCNNNNIKHVDGLQNLNDLKTLIIYDNPVTDSTSLQNLNVKNLIKTQKEFFEWQGNGHSLCEDILDYQTGYYRKKYGYLTYNVDSLLFGDTNKEILEFNDSTIVIKMDKGYNKFSYKLIIENDSITYDYDLIEKSRTKVEEK
ncbi:TPA: hypothetical protein DCR49_06635 [Candidatus Delongbacteria bacterium]|nr:MAG: hypothetical protein A2Y39_06405 [Candidatus Delongbacteria bacterium GWF2_40_14]HAQ61661.1 hypothetical protein [Candidatus Delongbacteria bacterium]